MHVIVNLPFTNVYLLIVYIIILYFMLVKKSVNIYAQL